MHNKTLNYTPAASGLRRTATSVLRTGCRLAQRYGAVRNFPEVHIPTFRVRQVLLLILLSVISTGSNARSPAYPNCKTGPTEGDDLVKIIQPDVKIDDFEVVVGSIPADIPNWELELATLKLPNLETRLEQMEVKGREKFVSVKFRKPEVENMRLEFIFKHKVKNCFFQIEKRID